MNRSFPIYIAMALALVGLSPRLHADKMVVQQPAGYSSRIDGQGKDYIRSSAVDAAGNVYVVGWSNSSEIKIDVMRGPTEGPDLGRPRLDVSNPLFTSIDPLWSGNPAFGAGFVIKYDREGNVLWRRSFGGLVYYSAAPYGVVVDSSGNAIVVGSFANSVQFGGISLSVERRTNQGFTSMPNGSSGDSNVFVAMIDRDGIWQWARQFDFALFESTRTNATNLNTEFPVTAGDINIVPDLSQNGLFASITGYQGFGKGLVIDSEGSIYMKMRASSSNLTTLGANKVIWIRSERQGQVAIASANSSSQWTYYDSVFLAKLAASPPPPGSPAGTQASYHWQWIAPVNSGVVYNSQTNAISSIQASATPASVTGMDLDTDGSLYVTGAWAGTLVAGGQARQATTQADGYVLRLRSNDAAPLYLATYANDIAGTGQSSGGGLVRGMDGNVYVTGAAANTSLLKLTSADGTIMTKALTGNANRTNFFLGKLNPSGEWLWAESPRWTLGADYALKANSIIRDAAGAIYVGGALGGNHPGQGTIIDFPGAGNIDHYGTGAEAFIAKYTEENADTRGWKWVLQSDFNGGGNTGGILDTADLLAGPGGTVYWSLTAASISDTPVTPTRFARTRSPNIEDRALDSAASGGSFLLPVLADLPKLSDQFSPAPTVLVGTEVPAPAGVFKDAAGKVLQPDITLPGANNVNGSGHFFWDTFEGKLYALSPALADVKWKVSDNPLNSDRVVRRVLTVWPTAAQGLITHVTGAGPTLDEPRVTLEPPTINHTFNTILYQDSNAQVIGAKQLSVSGTGYSVLLYTAGKNKAIGTGPAKLQVVRSYRWDDAFVNQPPATAIIGREISGAPYGHTDPGGKNGYIVHAKARYDGHGPGAAHNRATQLGPIIPVNEDEAVPDDDMVVIWSNADTLGVAWPAKTVAYTCFWPAGISDGAIVIASQLGSECVPLNPPSLAGEPLFPEKYQSMSVYHQPEKNLPGYNPNEEHALLGTSQTGSGLPAVFALRSDLNNLVRRTSQPYALLRYQDATDGMKTKFRVFKVVAENDPSQPGNIPSVPAYKFSSFTGIAGKPLLPPYPLSIFAGTAGTNGSGAAYFKDRKNQAWARSAGGIVMRYFYPIQPDFWYDVNGDGVQDATLEAPWLDRLPGGTIGTPIAVSYGIQWPEGVPQLRVGDTLTSARDSLPDIEAMSSVAIIHDQATPQPQPESGVRILDYTEERKVDVDATINGLSFTLGGLSLAVEPTSGGRFRFTDLPFHLKSRLTFDPINRQLAYGGYKDEPGLGVPLLLPNVMSDRERERLLAFDTPNEAA